MYIYNIYIYVYMLWCNLMNNKFASVKGQDLLESSYVPCGATAPGTLPEKRDAFSKHESRGTFPSACWETQSQDRSVGRQPVPCTVLWESLLRLVVVSPEREMRDERIRWEWNPGRVWVMSWNPSLPHKCHAFIVSIIVKPRGPKHARHIWPQVPKIFPIVTKRT